MPDEAKLNLELTANEALLADVRILLTCPSELLDASSQYFNTDTGFGIDEANLEKVLKLWADAKLPIERMTSVHSVLKHLFGEARKKNVSTEILLEEIRNLCEKHHLDGFANRRDALHKLLEPKARYLERRELVPFAGAIIPVLTSISGTIDIRAAYADDPKKVIGYLPIVQIRLIGQMDIDEERKLPFSFQVNAMGLRKLIEKLKIYQEQLEAVKVDLRDRVRLVEIADEDSENERK